MEEPGYLRNGTLGWGVMLQVALTSLRSWHDGVNVSLEMASNGATSLRVAL